MEFSRPEYWNEWPFPSPGELPNPGIEPRSPALQVDSLPAEHKGSPRILEWVAYPFSSRSSLPRNRTGVYSIAGGFFTSWAQGKPKNTGVGSLSLLDLPNSGIEHRSPALQVDPLPAEHKGSPRILEYVAYPFSSRSSRPRNQTRVSCIAGGFFTNWAIMEALPGWLQLKTPTILNIDKGVKQLSLSHLADGI